MPSVDHDTDVMQNQFFYLIWVRTANDEAFVSRQVIILIWTGKYLSRSYV